jgi:hypothetical protein
VSDPMIPWDQTGLPQSLLAGRIGRALPEDVRGGFVEGVLCCYIDWRLQKLQRVQGVAESKLVESDE